MSDKTLTRMDLAEAVHAEVGLSRNDSANLVETVLDHVDRKSTRLNSSHSSVSRMPSSA